MPDERGMFAVGEHHIDLHGVERVSNEWGFNSFATADGAESSLRRGARKKSHWYIWRLPDGTFDYSANPDPRTPPAEKELLREVDL